MSTEQPTELNGARIERADGEVLSLQIVQLEGLLDAAQAEIAALRKSKEGLLELLRDVQSDREEEGRKLQQDLHSAEARIAELLESDHEKMMGVLRVRVTRAEANLQDLELRHEAAVLREKFLRDDNRALQTDLASARARYETFAATLGAQVDALTGFVQNQARMVTAAKMQPLKRRRQRVVQILPTAVVMPAGLVLCQFVIQSSLEPGRATSQGEFVAFLAGILLVMVGLVWAVLFSPEGNEHGQQA